MFKQRSKIILQDEAAAWIARLSSDQLTSEDRHRFSCWLNASPEHKLAFDQMSALWGSLDSVCSLPSAKDMLESANNQAPNVCVPEIKHTEKLIHKFWTKGKGAIAASFLLVAVLAVIIPLSSPSPEVPSHQVQAAVEVLRYSTLVGERREIALNDGSVIELNTNSVVEVHFDAKKREISLLQGEVYFDVAKDRARPFIVNTGNGEVMAIGTAFNINRYDDKTIVTVTEGTVAVRNAQQDESLSKPSYVAPNQKVVINESGLGRILAIPRGENIEWMSNTVVFNEMPLPVALAEVGRYLPFDIHLTDPSLSQIKVSGTFSLGSPQATLEAIVATFNLSKTEMGSGIELRRVE